MNTRVNNLELRIEFPSGLHRRCVTIRSISKIVLGKIIIEIVIRNYVKHGSCGDIMLVSFACQSNTTADYRHSST